MARDAGQPLRSQTLSSPERFRRRRQPDALVASARNYKMPSDETRTRPPTSEAWQGLCWNWFDLIGEYRFGVEWVGNLLSKAKLTVLKDGKVVDPEQDAFAKAALAGLYGGPQGHGEMFRQCGIHFTVAGEGYIIGAEKTQFLDHWFVAASTEVSKQTGSDSPGHSGTWMVNEDILVDPLVIRLWKPHPRRALLADSPSRPLLDVLREIYGLTQHIAAQIDSRLSSAGILLIPSEVSFAPVPVTKPEGGPDEPATTVDTTTAAGVMLELIKIASMSLTDRSNASAKVPLVLSMAGEFIDKVTKLDLWSKMDEKVLTMRTEAIRRLALGMDMPPEALEGTGDMNHWSSWQAEEAAIKVHTEPLLAVITDALTDGYLLPFALAEDLGGLAPEEAARYSFGSDTTNMRLRPNRSKEALELHQNGILSERAVVRENGFDDTDIMTDDERKQWFLKKVAAGSTTPDIVLAALEQEGVKLDVKTVETTRGETPGEVQRITQAPSSPSLKDHPGNNIPDAGDAIAASAALMVDFALLRAGNKLRTTMGAARPTCSAEDTYMHTTWDPSLTDKLLEGSWNIVDKQAPRLGVDAAELKADLDAFTRVLLESHKPFEPEMLRAYLSMKAPV